MEWLIQEADRAAVLIDEETRGVVDVFFYDGSDEEEHGVQENLVAITGAGSVGWTCLRECHQ